MITTYINSFNNFKNKIHRFIVEEDRDMVKIESCTNSNIWMLINGLDPYMILDAYKYFKGTHSYKVNIK